MPIFTTHNLYNQRRNILTLSDMWRAALGNPECSGTWFIYGAAKNGKTTLSVMLAKELSQYGRVLYNSLEEGNSQSLCNAFHRAGISPTDRITPAQACLVEFIKILQRRNAPNFIFVDSIQFAGWTINDYKNLKARFNDRIIIYMSHVSGCRPEGATAMFIMRDANVIFRVEGFRAFPTSRYGGGAPIDVAPELAQKYWLSKS